MSAAPHILRSPGGDSMMSELMNMAYGLHGITTDYIQQVCKHP
jgi:hypothetical protein